MTILTMPDDRLREVSDPIGELSDGVAQLADDLIDLSYQYDGSGLAAVQVGDLRRLIVVTLPKEVYALANPEVKATSRDLIEADEGCLSIPGVTAPVLRHRYVCVEGLDVHSGEIREVKAYGTHARVLEHEINHLDGVLFIDHIPRSKRMRLMKEYNKRRK